MDKLKDAIFVALAVLAIALYIAIGGDGEAHQEHADWMASTKAAGAAVMW